MTRLSIQTGSRLHFGLLGWGPQALRQYGGVGLMIEKPGIELVAEPASEWSFEGPLAERVRDLVFRIVQDKPGEQPDLPNLSPATIKVVSTPSEHVGLGVGTQLNLAVVRILLELAGQASATLETVARLSGRGRRSGIGLHGFFHGGLIVDGGRRDEAHSPPLLTRIPFPEDWSVLMVQLAGTAGRHGSDEIHAFSSLPPVPDAVTERLCRLVLMGILPAVIEHDLSSFGSALSELQHHVGTAFAPIQGGVFATPQSEAIISELAELGLVGAGQSSWGPTLYAFGSLSESDRIAVSARLSEKFSIGPNWLIWTGALNHGALLQGDDG
jgi:beta-ribofuranosylaminobenzene 5'-phosphate synthase